MYVKGVTPSDLYTAASKCEGIRIKNGNHPHDGIQTRGNRLMFRISTYGPNPRYGRVGHQVTRTGKRRRVPGAVCWHGHRDFMLALFSLQPDCVLYTAMATYRGREDFLAKFPATEHHATTGLSSYSSLCNCVPDILRDAAREVIYASA